MSLTASDKAGINQQLDALDAASQRVRQDVNGPDNSIAVTGGLVGALNAQEAITTILLLIGKELGEK